MQKEHKNIDELFKSELSEHKVVAPTFVKDQLDKKLFGRKRFIYFSIALVAIFSISTFLIGNLNAEGIFLSENQSESYKNDNYSTSAIDTQIEKNNSQLSNEIIAKNKNALKDKNINLYTEKNTSLKGRLINNLNQENSFISKKNDPLLFSNTTVTKISDNTKSKNIITTAVNLTKKQKNNESDKVNSNNTLGVYKKDNFQTPDTENNVELEELVFNETFRIINKSESMINSRTKEFEKGDQDSISSLHHNYVQEQKIIDFTPNPRSTNYLFTLSSGINLSNPTYLANNSPDANYYQINNSENNNFEHNFKANILIKNKFIAGTGVGISKSSYDYSYNEITTTTCNCGDTLTMVEFIYAPSDTMQQFAPIDTLYTTIVDTTTTTITNAIPFNGTSSAHYVHIPFQIGYLFNLNKFMIGIQAKMRYNILYKSSGQYYMNNIVNSFDKSNSIFKKSYFDFAVQTDLYYNIYNNFYANASFRFTPKLNNTYQNIPIERKLNNMHFGMGLTYRF